VAKHKSLGHPSLLRNPREVPETPDRRTNRFKDTGGSRDTHTAYKPVKRHRGEPGHTWDTRVHTGTCAVSSFMNIGCDFQVTDIPEGFVIRATGPDLA